MARKTDYPRDDAKYQKQINYIKELLDEELHKVSTLKKVEKLLERD